MKRLGVGRFLGIAAVLSAFVGAAGCADETAATETTEEREGVSQAPIVEKAAEKSGAAEKSARKAERRDRKAGRAADGDDADRDGDRRPRGEHGFQGGKGGKGGHGGPEKLLFTALKELELTEAQKTAIEGAMSGMRDAREDRPEPDRTAFAAVAEQVRSGKVDAAAVDAAMEKGKPDQAARREATARALSTLHATLTPAQRKQLVDSIAARMDEHEDRDDERNVHGKGGPDGKRKGGQMGHLVRGLDLTDEQQAKVDAVLAGLAPTEADRAAFEAKHEAMRGEMRTRLLTFAADRFDASAFLPQKDGMKPEHEKKMGQALAAIVPLLDATQRAALADRLEQGPKGMKGMKGPRGMKGMKGDRAFEGHRGAGDRGPKGGR